MRFPLYSIRDGTDARHPKFSRCGYCKGTNGHLKKLSDLINPLDSGIAEIGFYISNKKSPVSDLLQAACFDQEFLNEHILLYAGETLVAHST